MSKYGRISRAAATSGVQEFSGTQTQAPDESDQLCGTVEDVEVGFGASSQAPPVLSNRT